MNWTIGLAVLLWGLLPLAAQEKRILSDEAVVSLWTVGPGPELYAAFGHSALRIQDPVLGVDRVYNFGTFDFATPNFYVKFTRGDLDYQLTAGIGPEVLEEYRDHTHQLVIEQDLDLTAAEKDALLVRLETNLRPENSAYRYDFVRDNCSTRIRDAVAAVVPVVWAEKPAPLPTIRELVQPFIANQPAVQNGINLLFSAATDHPASASDAMFLPGEMEQAFAGAVISSSTPRPLVKETRILCPGLTVPAPVFDWVAGVIGLLALLGMIATFRDWRWFRWIDLLLFLFAAIAGCLCALMWFYTRHWVTHGNWNLLWAWPTHLVIWFFPLAIRRSYWKVCAVIMFALVPGLFFVPQVIAPAVILLVLLLGFRAWSRSRI